jgi:macrolide-specific efflux system membrane fusion protein
LSLGYCSRRRSRNIERSPSSNLEETVRATGIVWLVRQVDVGTRVTGQLKTLQVKLGDHVMAGDILADRSGRAGD